MPLILRITLIVGLSGIIYLIGTEREAFRRTDIGDITFALVMSVTIGLMVLVGTN